MNKVAVLFLLISTFLLSQEIDFHRIPQIQTKATYTTEVVPDKITLAITLSEQNTKGKVSIEELESKMKQVLTSNNVDITKQLNLTDLSSNFKDYFLKKTDVQKVKNYQLELYDAASAGKILKGLESQEISNVRLIKTEYIKLEELKIELKGKAVAKAKKQAEEMVENLNQTLGAAIYISDLETYNSNSNLGSNSISIGYGVQSNTELDIDFENIIVNATVVVYFKLE